MLATARLTGQTIGAILAAISFRIAGHSETVALAGRLRWAGYGSVDDERNRSWCVMCFH